MRPRALNQSNSPSAFRPIESWSVHQLFRDFEIQIIRDRFISSEIQTRPLGPHTVRSVSLGRRPTQGRGEEQREHATTRWGELGGRKG